MEVQPGLQKSGLSRVTFLNQEITGSMYPNRISLPQTVEKLG